LNTTTCIPTGWSNILIFDNVKLYPDKVLCYNGVNCDCIQTPGTGPGLWWQSNYSDCIAHITQPSQCCDIYFPNKCTCCESNLPILAVSSGWTNSIAYSGPLDAGNQLQMKFLNIVPGGSYKMWLNECVQFDNVWSPTQGVYTDCCACCVITDSYTGPIPFTSALRGACNVSTVTSIGGLVLSSNSAYTDWVSCGVDEDCVSCPFPPGTVLG